MIQRHVLAWLLLMIPATLLAASESYIQTLSGKIKKGDSCTVVDDKFLHLPLLEWNQLNHLSVNNIVSFELRSDTSVFYYNRSFTCSLNVTIKYFTSRDQQTPDEISNVDLVVKYDTTKGSFHPVSALYKFKNAFKVIVVINSIKSQELGEDVPAVFRVKNQILVERKYPFNPQVNGFLHLSQVNQQSNNGGMTMQRIGLSEQDRQLTIAWDVADFNNSEEYDVEWAFIDAQSGRAADINNLYTSNGVVDIPDAILEEWMRNDNTRVTVTVPSYVINLAYGDGYVLVRVRGAYYQPISNSTLRIQTNWLYRDESNKTAIEAIDAFEPGMNWKYTAAFAEDGKRKEVVDFADGTLRTRQSVSLVNSNQTLKNGSPVDRQETAVVQETIYDNMGRPAINVIPAPVRSKSLAYYSGFNKNPSNQPYSHTDILLNVNSPDGSCAAGALPMGISSGSSQYFSPSNSFINDPEFYFTGNVPNADGFPYALTQYTPDNTGRLRRQGGVGSAFQIGSGHESQYYYGKPSQKELDRLFGAEMGDASHYLKNMVVDPNGQINVTYLDAKGKVIATALAGGNPSSVDQLSSNSSEARTTLNQRLISPINFNRDAAAMMMRSTATFMAAVTGTFNVHYSINPASLITTHGQSSQFCSNCHYEVLIEVRNDCGVLKGGGTVSTAFLLNDVTCNSNVAPVTGTVPVSVDKVGEYYVTYTLRLKEDAVSYQVDYYIEHNSNLKKLQDFFLSELIALDLNGCYTTCEECKLLGNSMDVFREKVIELLSGGKFVGIDIGAIATGNPIRYWIDNTWMTLKQRCGLLSASCNVVSACDTYLEQMKADVRPGGQYALYNSETFLYLERDINVLRYYKLNESGNEDIYNLSYTDDDGNAVLVRNLSEQDFIKVYTEHPEWADLFVKKHIEYCSYLWCKDASYANQNLNNERSYNFDKLLRDVVVTGADATGGNYYNRSNMMALLNMDPFFNGGRGSSYLDEMQADLNNLSNAIGFIVKDESGNVLPGKNIFQYIDWQLYCKPVAFNTTGNQFVSSWTSCAPDNSCRSVTREWELYREYYLKIKSKYVRIVKEQVNPFCVNCFVGGDALSEPPCVNLPLTAFTRKTIGTGRDSWDVFLQYNEGMQPFPATYIVTYTVRSGVDMSITQHTVTAQKGALQVLLLSTSRFDVVQAVLSVTCAPQSGSNLGNCSGDPVDPGPCPIPSNFHYEDVNFNTTTGPQYTFSSHDRYYVHNGGPVNRPVIIHGYMEMTSYWNPVFMDPFTVVMQPGEDRVYLGQFVDEWHDANNNYAMEEEEVTRISYYVFPESTECPPVAPPPIPSRCSSDPRYQLYVYKSRVFNEYVNEAAYQNCLIANAPTSAPTEADMLQGLRNRAIDDLEPLRTNWRNRLKAVRDEEAPTFNAVTDNMIEQLVNVLYAIAQKNIQLGGTAATIRPASTLPSNQVPSVPYNTFADAFNGIIGSSLVQQGFSPYLLDKPYPHDKTPIELNPNSGEISTGLCSNLTALKTRFNTSGASSFYDWLKQELQEDFVLTQAQLADLESRCTISCRYLADPIMLPAALASPAPANSDHPFVSCTRIASLNTAFLALFPGINTNSKLYYTLFTNYMNHQLGYALSSSEYIGFQSRCSMDAQAVLYNKPASPLIVQDYLACVAPAIKGAYERAGQEYDLYIALERSKFRNRYVSKCLSSNASAFIEGDQYEYHYTLFYFDQSNNLVKTIPPEGVRLLSSAETDLVEEYRGFDASTCTGSGIPATENKTVTFNALSSALQNNTGKSLEFWLHSSSNSPSRQVRIITPDNKYFYQVAIHDKRLWVELYSLTPGSTAIEITLTNHAIADISQSALQPWSHLVVQSTSFNSAIWDLYLDGRKLTLLPAINAPPYPFAWEIASGFTLPAEELALLKHVRFYSNTLSDATVYANYKSSCLSPGVSGLPILTWGRFNVPAAGGETTTGPGSTTEYVSRFIVPQHGLSSTYVFNSNDQVIRHTTPDEGTTQVWYDRIGRLAVSQNAEQLESTNFNNYSNTYTYTRHDVFGRVVETGVRQSDPATVNETEVRRTGFMESFSTGGYRRHIKQLLYDAPPADAYGGQGEYTNLRGRVASTVYIDDQNNASRPVYKCLYSYDIAGNVKMMHQAYMRPDNNYFLSRIDYDYDLVSGKVNRVRLNDGTSDQFFYDYQYDADNRIIEARTSRDKLIWNTEASYRYFLHGPLARTELGHLKVQGIDYAYTLQGWLKGINSHRLDPNADMAQDGKPGSSFSQHGRDVMAFSIGYFNNDYSPIGSGVAFPLNYQASPPGTGTGVGLYNGNITHTTLALSKLNNGAVTGYSYRYDQLHRLKQMRMHTIGSGNSWSNSNIVQDYQENVAYDGNGNILAYQRYGANPSAPMMDNLEYIYNRDANGRLINNKLLHVIDPVPAGGYTTPSGKPLDVVTQQSNNYWYDKVGNLVKDISEDIEYIHWDPYGKLSSYVNLEPNYDVVESSFWHDLSGNRIIKRITSTGQASTRVWNYYVRDAEARILAVYKWTESPPGQQEPVKTEQHLYGRNRLGVWRPDPNEAPSNPPSGNVVVGQRSYELVNHLGTVMTVISDRKTGVDADNNGTIDHYEAEVLSATDYYPFGMIMPGRKWGLSDYRFGFNGKENDNDAKGEGNQIDFGLRIYDPRIGRFLSSDPLSQSYPWYTPYQYAGNKPVWFIDLDGASENPPQYLLKELKVDMSKAPDVFKTKGGIEVRTIIRKGRKYNAAWAWDQIRGRTKDAFSARNNALIDLGLSPTSDPTFINKFKVFENFKDQVLEIHHLNHGPTTSYGLPRQLHRGKGFTKLWHKFGKPAAKVLLSATMILALVDFAQGNPMPNADLILSGYNDDFADFAFDATMSKEYDGFVVGAEGNNSSEQSRGIFGVYYATDYEVEQAINDKQFPDLSKAGGGKFIAGGWNSFYKDSKTATVETKTAVTHAFIYYRYNGEKKFTLVGIKPLEKQPPPPPAETKTEPKTTQKK